MRSVQVTKANGPFEIVDRDIPEPDNKQVRIKVQACGICHSDSFTKEGLFPGIVYPRVPGHEVAGIIDKVGYDVTQWESGQRVAVGWYGGHCGHCESCRRGDFITCKFAQVPGMVEELNKLGGAKVVLATVPSGKAMTEILGGLAASGKLVIIGASDEPIEVPPALMILGRRSLIGWPAGTSIDSQDTLSFSVLSGVRSMNEVFPLERASEAYDHMMSGKAKFRCVLTTGK